MKIYEQALGQMVNMDKSSILFKTITSIFYKETTMNLFNIHQPLENDRYLGLPLLLGRSKSKEFRAIKDFGLESTDRGRNYFLQLRRLF